MKLDYVPTAARPPSLRTSRTGVRGATTFLATALFLVLAMLVPPRAAAASIEELTVVLVSGLGSTWDAPTFTDLPRALVSHGSARKVTVRVTRASYRFPSEYFWCGDSSGSVRESARKIANQLRTEISRTRGQIALIGHSLGGVVSLLAVAQLSNAERARVKRVTVIDSPIAGVGLAEGLLAGIKAFPCASSSRPQIAADLSRSGSVIRDTRAAAMSLPTFAMTNKGDCIVPEHSARFAGVRGVTYDEAARNCFDAHSVLLGSTSGARRAILAQTIGP